MTKHASFLFFAVSALSALTTGCSNIGEMMPSWGTPVEHTGAPANATEYQCAAGKYFYVRMLDNGATAWIILSDREVALTKDKTAGNRYSNGAATLDIGNSEATFNDGPDVAYVSCKVPAKK